MEPIAYQLAAREIVEEILKPIVDGTSSDCDCHQCLEENVLPRVQEIIEKHAGTKLKLDDFSHNPTCTSCRMNRPLIRAALR